MKAIMKKILFICAASMLIWACKKEESRVIYKGSIPPILSSSVTGTVPLSYSTADQTALVLSWTNPEYQFNNGVSSLDVSYLIEIDTAGSNFTNPSRQSITVSKDLGLTILQRDFNNYLLNQLQLDTGSTHNIEIRVTSSMPGNLIPVTSNVVSLKAKPYAIPPVVNPPASGTLYITGDATPDGWMVGGDPNSVANQQLTQVTSTLYEITLNLIGGKQFLLVPVAGDWTNKYACKKTSDQPLTGGDFGYNWSDNFPGPASDGTYKVSVDFQRGKYTITKQ